MEKSIKTVNVCGKSHAWKTNHSVTVSKRIILYKWYLTRIWDKKSLFLGLATLPLHKVKYALGRMILLLESL